MYGMSEYLMFAHEIERARLLAREARKEHHREEETSLTGKPPESYGRTREGTGPYPIADGTIAARAINDTTENAPS